MKESYAIELRNISKRFGRVIANDQINLSVRNGEILAILGENGSGKTTLMNMISGIYYPDEGQIFVHGEEVTIRSPKDAFPLGLYPFVFAACILPVSIALNTPGALTNIRMLDGFRNLPRASIRAVKMIASSVVSGRCTNPSAVFGSPFTLHSIRYIAFPSPRFGFLIVLSTYTFTSMLLLTIAGQSFKCELMT